jgi:TRAP-type C4-dicarboxylate transport system permease small subunit
VSLVLRAVAWLPHVAVTVLMLVAMVDMLLGVFLRYVMTWVSARFDLPSVRFFWVEEIGEYALAWLTFIGAAIGIRRGTHFAFSPALDLNLRWLYLSAVVGGILIVVYSLAALADVLRGEVPHTIHET